MEKQYKLIISGPACSGKSTLSRYIAKSIGCSSVIMHDISNVRISDLRDYSTIIIDDIGSEISLQEKIRFVDSLPEYLASRFILVTLVDLDMPSEWMHVKTLNSFR